MRFCDKCGSYMRETKDGYVCRKCGNAIKAKPKTESRIANKPNHPDSVYVIDDSNHEAIRVAQVCPNCGNTEAFRSYSRISGEHAGVNLERTIEHYQCTKCQHIWATTT